MTLDGIDVFVEVADAKSFSSAAKRLDMPTTTVSAKIARLEERLGVTLLRRTTRKISLTEAGEIYYADCAPALKELERAQANVRNDSLKPSGTLRMTAPPDIAQMVLGPVFDVYLQRHRDVEIDLRVTNSFVDLVADKIDLAIRVGQLEDSSLIVRKLTQGSLSLWAAPSYIKAHGMPSSPAELANHSLIWLRNRQKSIELSNPQGERISLTSTHWLDIDDVQTLKHYVQCGLGIGLLPQFDIPSKHAFSQLTPILPDFKTAAVNAAFAYPKQKFVPMSVRSFIDTALEVMRG